MKTGGGSGAAGSVPKTMEIPPGLSVMDDGKPFFFEGGKVGCLLLHGFTGTTSSMKPMGEYLAGKGLTVLGPRLPGHGTDVKDMGRWSHNDWTRTAELALSELQGACDDVFVSGLSMGGTLTLYLGERFSEGIAGIMPICTPVFMKNPALKLVPALKYLVGALPGPGNDLKDPDAREVAYEKLSVKALHELVKLMKLVHDNLDRVTVPIRVFQARDDHAVLPENAPYILEHVGSTDKELIWLDNSFHVATLDFDKEKIFEDSCRFIRENAG
ncbi:MAG: alpha/beta fold hydrolase [Actinobacteria bacterium]|nr:alpha/beta fold hydrolase [Actinomycetota bacterium]MCG2794393.1 alpha/beta fold hydrolase [Actinomycetes bacterium]MBU4240742.1 alpha/beta fold hydrolase [Actinomycetota bacterium]MBU4302294.1 alpha/beta fold hydrolase [Actinomycetota bacterium]MBU4385888.1 alpha/beta fold hydrolase [Actinomycetota bacterium]